MLTLEIREKSTFQSLIEACKNCSAQATLSWTENKVIIEFTDSVHVSYVQWQVPKSTNTFQVERSGSIGINLELLYKALHGLSSTALTFCVSEQHSKVNHNPQKQI